LQVILVETTEKGNKAAGQNLTRERSKWPLDRTGGGSVRKASEGRGIGKA